jgi:hypothetical protein
MTAYEKYQELRCKEKEYLQSPKFKKDLIQIGVLIAIFVGMIVILP